MVVISASNANRYLPALQFDWQAYLTKLEQQSRVPFLQRFYQCANLDHTTALANLELVALDLETTGLDANKNEIISIGIVPFTLSRIYCQQAKYWLVKPQKKLTENSVIIHSITHSDVNDAPPIKTILAEVVAALQGKVVVVHYRSIERNFLHSAMSYWQGEPFYFPMIDTLEIETWFLRSKKHRFWSWLTGNALASIRLAGSRQRYNLPYYQGHNALTDAIATADRKSVV